MTDIGIDPGVKTGVAVAYGGEYVEILSTDILEAMDIILKYKAAGQLRVTIENPRQYKDPNYLKYGRSSAHKAQGAGSIKRDFSIWETFFKRHNIYYIAKSPLAVGRMFENAETFILATGWTKSTNVHAREAAKLIYQYTKPKVIFNSFHKKASDQI